MSPMISMLCLIVCPSSDIMSVGNGASMSITHHGNGIIPTPTHSFKRNRVLHSPQFASNLISPHKESNPFEVTARLLSISKFASDNNCNVLQNASGYAIQDNASCPVPRPL